MAEQETTKPAFKKRPTRDFFVSFNKADTATAQLLRGWLEEAGYSTFMQHPDFHAGSNIVLKMDEGVKTCRRVLAVVSANYLSAEFTQPEWAAFFAKDPRGELGLVVAARIRPCQVDGLLGVVRYIDLAAVAQDEWCDKFLREISDLPAARKGTARRKPSPPAALAVPPPSSTQAQVTINVTGNAGNVAGRDFITHHYERPVKPKVVLERRDDWISSAQAAELKERMKDFAEFRFKTMNGKLTMAQAFQYSWGDFNRDHDIPRYDALPAIRFEEALSWFRTAKGILTRKLRKLDRPLWQKARMGSIKRAMKTMGRTNEDYYPEVAARLEMKKPFTSLNDVTDKDLQRIYTMALRDAGENEE
jgi:hypothetical protein